MDDKHLSRKVFTVMDYLGYSPSIVAHRRTVYREMDRKVNLTNEFYTRVKAGSKGEGFSSFYESDHDALHIDHHTVCTLPEDERSFPETHTVFTMLNEHLHPGHFELQRKQQGTLVDYEMNQALIVNSENGKVYISSDLYTEALKRDKLGNITWDEQVVAVTGPSVPGTDGKISWDSVHAFRCVCQQQLLAEWITRPRQYNWPPRELIETISRIEAQLVPAGSKGSKNRKMEWRVCFIPSELKLSESLSQVQYKMYILLKMINKEILKPICNELSSYIMKNIVFWMVESNPHEIFTEDSLLHNTISCLKMLQEAIQKTHLSYFMIRSRNLLLNRLTPNHRHQLYDKLQELVKEGPRLILRCGKLANAINSLTTDQLEDKSRLREELERLALQRESMWDSYGKPEIQRETMVQATSRDEEYLRVSHRMCDLVWPDWRRHCHDDDFQETVQGKIRAELS